MNLIVIRNTEAPSNVNYIVGGRSEESLTERGIMQAKELRKKLEQMNYDVIITSPVNRAVETAKIINYKNISIIKDERITERDSGDLLLKDRNLVNKTEWNSMKKLRTKDNAETLLALVNRTNEFIEEIRKKYKNETVLIVTHNSICRALWMIKNEKEKSKEEINSFYHNSEDIKVYNYY